jgi:outer membrane receptor protein involved in Fe transport
LVATSGNVSDAGAGGRGVGFAINGQRESGTNVLLDGAANNNEFTAGVGQSVPLDSIQEFSILTGNFTAEFGRASGGVVNVVTKSGTNEFHGTAYEFNRVSDLSSNGFNNNAYGIPKSVFDRNQFGYSFGGPAIKNKLFFFSSTEWIRIRSIAATEVMVPDPNLIAASAPNTQQFFSTYGKLATGASVLNTYSINQLNALGSNLCGTVASCNALNPNMPVYDLVTYNAPGDAGGGTPENSYQTVARVDYNLSEKTQMYARYALESIGYFPGSVSSSPYQGYNTLETDFNNNILFSVVHSFSPQLISQSKVVFNRLNDNQPLGSYPPVPTLYTSAGGTNALLGQEILYPGYYPNGPGQGIPFGGPQNFVQIYEDVSRIFGKHNLRFGGSFEYLRDNRTFGAYETAGDYLGTGSTGSAVAGLLSGDLHELQVAINPQGHFPGQTVTEPLTQPNFSRSFRYKESALYVQDAWKLRPRLTLNLGLRWEYYGVQHDKHPQLDSNFYFPSNEINTPQGFVDGSAQLAPNSSTGGFWSPQYKDFAPRVGIAWDVFGDGKTSLRGGYGIGYERNFGNVTFNAIQNPPNYETVSITSASGTIPISTSNLGPFAGSSGTITLPPATLRVPLQNIKTAYAHMYSVSLEHQFSKNLVAGADYSGSRGENLYDVSVNNRPGYGNVFLGEACSYDAGDCTARLNTQYGYINTRGNNAWSRYNGLTFRAKIDNLASSGLHLNFNYTWSHAIDNLSSSFSDADGLSNNWGNFNTGLLDPFAPNVTKGNADFDIRQRMVVSAVWDVPGFKAGRSLASQVLGGWSVAPIFTARTGSPYTIFDCTNAYTDCPMAAFTAPVSPAANGTPSPVGSPNTFTYLTIPSSVDNFTNPKYFYSDLPPFPSDMTGRNTFRAPGIWNLDMGMYKSVKINERFRLQLRGEMYNLFNHANLYVEGAAADVSSTSYIPAEKLGRRNVQFAMKLIF